MTGGARGIGRATAALLAARGYRVAVADLERAAGSADVVACDVSSELSVEACVREVADRFGRLDALVNNAAIAGASNGPLEQLALAEWNRRIGTNLTGVFLMAKHCAPLLRAARW